MMTTEDPSLTNCCIAFFSSSDESLQTATTCLSSLPQVGANIYVAGFQYYLMGGLLKNVAMYGGKTTIVCLLRYTWLNNIITTLYHLCPGLAAPWVSCCSTEPHCHASELPRAAERASGWWCFLRHHSVERVHFPALPPLPLPWGAMLPGSPLRWG